MIRWLFFSLWSFIWIGILFPYKGVTEAQSQSSSSNQFELVSEAKSFNNDPIEVYKSLQTGLHVIIANIEGPVVNGYFTIATEASNDDGLPHTLEHLVFMGSEDFPFKGLLDLLANRCLARGTNAWTAVDHTAYTAKTAGKEGFLNLLPIFLDHLLYPTLTTSSFITEVYHVTGEGQDAGVVYSEMQGRENTGGSLTYNEIVRIMYPAPSGYYYETGGLMKNLRDNITIDKIRDYHADYYRPENLYLIITGSITADEIFTRKDFQDFEKKIVSKLKQGSQPPFEMPWKTKPPPFSASVTKEILYPSSKETTGLVRVGWLGPSIVNDVEGTLAMDILFDYLTVSSVSPLERAFVDRNDPLASQVFSYQLEHIISGMIIFFEGVPLQKISQVEPHLTATLNDIANDVTPLDVGEIRDILQKQIQKEESKMETNPHGTIANYLIRFVLYGNYDSNYLNQATNKLPILQKLLTKDKEYWLTILRTYVIDKPMAVVNGIPSIAESKRLKDEVEARVAKRRSDLGPDGLQRLRDIVDNATRINDIAPNATMLQAVPIPSTKSIQLHPLTVYSNINNLPFIIDQIGPSPVDFSRVPFKVELDHVNSNFVQLVAKLDTTPLSNFQKLLLPLFLELLLESPIQKEDGSLIPHTEVIKLLNAQTVEASTLNGLQFSNKNLFSYGHYFSVVCVNIKVDMASFEDGMRWMKDILFNVVVNPERILVKINQILNSVEENKNSGSNMVKLMSYRVNFNEESNVNRGNSLVQERIIKRIMKSFDTNKEVVVANINELYQTLTSPDGISLHIASDLTELSSRFDITSHLETFLPNNGTGSLSLNVVSDHDQKTTSAAAAAGASQSNTGYIAGLGSVESGFLYQTVDSINDYNHIDLPSLMVAISYFTQLEGPFWKEIRGLGLAYSSRMRVAPNEGTLTFELNRASQLSRAYEVAINILRSHINKTQEWDLLFFESAKSSLLSGIVAREEDIIDVVQQSLLSYNRKVTSDYNKKFLDKVSAVTFEEMQIAGETYLEPLLDPKRSKTVIVCQASKEAEAKQAFDTLGHNLEIVPDLENSIFSEY